MKRSKMVLPIPDSGLQAALNFFTQVFTIILIAVYICQFKIVKLLEFGEGEFLEKMLKMQK
jgi:hypothetical protein